MASQTIRVGPADHGRLMTLADFGFAEGCEGHLHELGRGVVSVTQVPGSSISPRSIRSGSNFMATLPASGVT
jgi:hypothetical protein